MADRIARREDDAANVAYWAVTARKPHRCEFYACLNVIQPGERYLLRVRYTPSRPVRDYLCQLHDLGDRLMDPVHESRSQRRVAAQ